MAENYKVGTRISHLALKQVEETLVTLRKFYPDFKAEVVGIETYGDKDKMTPISEIEGTDFFTREIDQALLDGKIDFAVHSAKDLPGDIPDGLYVVAITKAIYPHDALVSKHNLRLDELRKGAKVGASSLRRKTQLKKYREDFQIVDIRGTIEERLWILDTNGLDAIIVAECALARLGLKNRIIQRIPFEILKPNPLQGALAVLVRQDNQKLKDLLKVLDER
ncbi:MAG: hydroxymethylbilane synthase [Candidatus Omnitrophota bacterium]|nr:hydroxymethylbilane synthase [Candidatus Omnitrophota bacterium]